MAASISIDIIFQAVNKAMPTINALDRGFSGINNNLWKVNQAAEAWNKTSQTISQVSAPFQAYDQGMKDLESITGITGKELQDLGKQARKVGKESGLGADGAIDAYKLLASQIDVSKIGMAGLNDLQAKTVTLAQASGMDLTQSANALAGTLNQFGLGAEHSNRVINMLAAGSKYGAAEVYELSASFKVAGTAAAAAGLNVEQTGGAIEAMSKAGIKGAEAGTALRNILLNMQTKGGIDFNTTSFEDALKSLQGKEGDAEFMNKMFGADMGAAQFLIKNTELVGEMTARMTDSNVAAEQAEIRNKSFNHFMDVQKAKLNDLSIAFFKNNEGILKMAQGTGQLAAGFTSVMPLVGGLGKGLTGAVKGMANTAKAARLMSAAMAAGKLGTYSDLIARYGAAGKVAAVGIKISTLAQGAWNAVSSFTTATMVPLIASTWAWTAALLANPITWVVVGVGALIAGLALAWKHFDGFRGAVVGAWEGIKSFGKILFDAIINPLKQIIGGIGKVGKAMGHVLKGQFGQAAAVAKEGFGDIGKGAVMGSPAGVAMQVATRRGEIGDAAKAGYAKGKAMQPGKKGTPITTDGTKIDTQTAYNLNNQTHKFGEVKIPGAVPMNQATMKVVKTPGATDPVSVKQPTAVTVPGAVPMNQPAMKVVKTPGVVDPVAVKQPAAVTVPGAVAMNQPAVPGINIPGTVNAAAPPVSPVTIPGTVKAQQPNMKVVKAPGMVDPLSVPQPASVTVPAAVAMSQPAVPGITIPGQIDAAQPEAKPMDIPGNVILNVQKIQALNFLGALSFAPPKKIDEKQATAATGNMVDLTKNITNNISKSETNNQTNANTNNANSARIEVNYNPVINISAAMDARATDDLMKMLADNKDELMRLINEEMRRNNRLAYAG
jgi:TP901 family phage tail tape measure protein